jgi:hypothetical protein
MGTAYFFYNIISFVMGGNKPVELFNFLIKEMAPDKDLNSFICCGKFQNLCSRKKLL